MHRCGLEATPRTGYIMGHVRTSQNPSHAAPFQPFHHLDALWIQVAGSLCNLTCAHCFVSCGPHEHRHVLLSRAQVRERVAEALALGVKEFYFTGGEPFLHPDLLEILEDTVAHGPATVLTNGTLLTRARLQRWAALARDARYSLELRVSLDGWSAEVHDGIRGPGSFDRALSGLVAASRLGLLPIVTVTRPEELEEVVLRRRYHDLLRRAGIERPRLKILPLFRLGREIERTRPYAVGESLSGLPAEAFDPGRLQCGSCRAVTSRGVFVCPLLVDEPRARMGDRLGEASRAYALVHGACSTCYATGMTCGNG
jgi:uncharacterized Fe-S cluster-containing radical SAM superfamily protein